MNNEDRMRLQCATVCAILVTEYSSFAAHHDTTEKRQAFSKLLLSAASQRAISDAGFTRIKYWIDDNNSQWAPTIGEMMTFSKMKTPLEFKKEDQDRLNSLLLENKQETTVSDFAKQSMKKIMESL